MNDSRGLSSGAMPSLPNIGPSNSAISFAIERALDLRDGSGLSATHCGEYFRGNCGPIAATDLLKRGKQTKGA